MEKDVDGLDRTTEGTLYLSITRLQREDSIASFGCVGHVQPALWSRGCYCKHKGTGSSVFYAGWSGFLRFCDAVHVPPLSRCPPAVHIGRCTNKAGTYFRRSYLRLQPRSCACLVVPSPQTRPHAGKVHTKETGRSGCCHGLNFEGCNTFFQKYMKAVPQRACSFISLWYGWGP